MPQHQNRIPCPLFVALDYDGDAAASDDNLSVVLDQLRQSHDPDDGEELCVWRDGSTIAAVVRSDGSIHVFDQQAAQERPPSVRNGKRRK